MVTKSFADYGINVAGKQGEEVKTVCPQCSPHRKKQNYPCLNVNTVLGVWHCWHCDWAGSLKNGADKGVQIWRPSKTFRRPKAQAFTTISSKWADWLASRGINHAIADAYGVFSASVYMPQTETEVDAIAWPYKRAGELVNIKYRDADKNFRMCAGAECILYGIDDINTEALVWVEGEMDKLSLAACGLKSCVSVPHGAPAPKTKNYSSKFDYLESAQEIIEKVQLHVIAVDNDEPGKRLEEELARRLGADKCVVVHWPDGCKDANDVLRTYGADELCRCINEARPYPIAGVFTPEDVSDKVMVAYEEGQRRGKLTGWPNVDELYTVRECEWTLITGIPGSGKSEWLDALMVNLATNYGWRFAVCSPENQPLENHMVKLIEKISGKPFEKGPNRRASKEDVQRAMNWLQESFSFVLPERVTLDEILDRCKVLIKRKGINGIVIDPWNEIEACKQSSMSETEYISNALSRLRRFARENYVHLWIVAHPAKLKKDERTGQYPVPTPYDVSGSAHWRNKADNSITVHRDPLSNDNSVAIHVQKVRFKIVGRVGQAKLIYDRVCGRYYMPNESPTCNYMEDE